MAAFDDDAVLGEMIDHAQQRCRSDAVLRNGVNFLMSQCPAMGLLEATRQMDEIHEVGPACEFMVSQEGMGQS